VRLSFSFVLLASGVNVSAQLPDSDRARTLLENSLKDKNPDTRKQAEQALGLVGPREPYLSELASMLNDRDIEVRLATIRELGRSER
jgi:HEAT repeat protein